RCGFAPMTISPIRKANHFLNASQTCSSLTSNIPHHRAPLRFVSAAERREWLLFALLIGPNLGLFCLSFTYYLLFYNGYLSFVRWDISKETLFMQIRKFVAGLLFSAVLAMLLTVTVISVRAQAD